VCSSDLFLAQLLADLGLVDHDDVLARRLIDDLLARVSAASTLDQIQACAHLVGPIDGDVDVPGSVWWSERDAEAFGLLATLFTRGNGYQSSPLFDQLTHSVDEMFGG